MRVDFNAKNIVSFVKENVPKFITEQQKKIILIVSVVLGLCCIAYWIRSRSLKERATKLDGETDLERNSRPATPENMSTSAKVQSLEDGLLSANHQLREENSSIKVESPVTRTFKRSSNQLRDRSPRGDGDLESEGEESTTSDHSNGNSRLDSEDESSLKGSDMIGLTADLEGVFSEEVRGEVTEIDSIASEIHSDAAPFIDYVLEKFSIGEGDFTLLRLGERRKTFVYELDIFDGNGSYRFRDFPNEEPKEGEVLFYFKGSATQSEKISLGEETNLGLLTFQTSWIEGGASPKITLYARELKSDLESRNFVSTGAREVLQGNEQD